MKVICIIPISALILNNTYTVIGETKYGGFLLYEIKAPFGYHGFWKWRFRPIEEKGDMFIEEFVSAVIKNIIKEK